MTEIFGSDLSFSAELKGRGNAVVKVGGHDISRALRGFDLSADVNERPRVTLELAIVDATRLESEHTEVGMPSATRELLIAAGWQPPGGGSDG